MTKQIEGRFTYGGVPARALALYRWILFSPAETLGIEPGYWATMNYNGFWCDYAVDGELIIRDLHIFSRDHTYPEINGRAAEEDPDLKRLYDSLKKANPERNWVYVNTFPMLYRDVGIRCEYTGRIVFAPEQAGGRVYDTAFEKGLVTEKLDITKEWRLFTQKRKTSGRWWEPERRRYFYRGYEVTDPRLAKI